MGVGDGQAGMPDLLGEWEGCWSTLRLLRFFAAVLADV
jgi:hypothetical protein